MDQQAVSTRFQKGQVPWNKGVPVSEERKQKLSKTCMIKALYRFWSRVQISSLEEDCWIWQGNIVNNYGQFWIKNKPERAHRVAWLSYYGDIPDNLFVLHACDNRLCCNPKHLFLGTHKDNMRDMCSKNRQFSKLTKEKAQEIRTLYKELHLSYRELAQNYGVSKRNIGSIIRGEIWKHCEGIDNSEEQNV